MFNLSRGESGTNFYKVKLTRLLRPIHEGEKPDENIPDDIEDSSDNIFT